MNSFRVWFLVALVRWRRLFTFCGSSYRVEKLWTEDSLGLALDPFRTLDAQKRLKYSANVQEAVDLLWGNQKICHFLSPVRLSVSHRRSPPRKAFSFLPCSIPPGN